jgi:hypothetical protein
MGMNWQQVTLVVGAAPPVRFRIKGGELIAIVWIAAPVALWSFCRICQVAALFTAKSLESSGLSR